MKMNNNVYGIMGIGVKNGNWNAGWDQRPKTNGEDIIKGSSYALQYCIKNQWNNIGKKVFGIKTMQKEGTCTTLTQRYTFLFDEEDKGINKKDKDKVEKIKRVKNNLLSCKDVLHFGVAYTGATNMNIKGLVQFTDGENKFEETNIIDEKILSPFGNPKADDPTMNTNGTKYITDEAHYIYDFSVFPKEYNKYIDDGFDGYTEEDYEDFKKVSLIAVSNYNSKAKAGCKNEFAMFIKIKEGSNYLLDLNNLQDYVKVYKDDDDKIFYDLSMINNLIDNVKEKIEDIEIYYNPRTVELEGFNKNEKTTIFDLITRKEI
ncbi:hypothetical protein K144316041_p21310 (plasmid) [Clostridium tetani]|uniref:type I CRISPR-associated protein Cas7 n=1 Tax=Clostridium tetani TaxID=1513 RepID=UPI00295511BF|nr:type I CRISPR-associated protein Cas7 [Clostridium tetani]BDR74292.1 hypothetical protein K144316041_p21310 [Clostridium tetani]